MKRGCLKRGSLFFAWGVEHGAGSRRHGVRGMEHGAWGMGQWRKSLQITV